MKSKCLLLVMKGAYPGVVRRLVSNDPENPEKFASYPRAYDLDLAFDEVSFSPNSIRICVSTGEENLDIDQDANVVVILPVIGSPDRALAERKAASLKVKSKKVFSITDLVSNCSDTLKSIHSFFGSKGSKRAFDKAESFLHTDPQKFDHLR